MGLLDDAIREHLDLKRARGADPAEIERLEREALGPVRREPTFGGAQATEYAPRTQARFEDEAMNELEELQERGYHDSTAPHPHPHHPQSRSGEDRFDEFSSGLRAPEPEPEDIHDREPPKRRFLRRPRQEPEPEALPHDEFGTYEEEGHDYRGEHLEQNQTPSPPQLRFEQPPRRPHFSAEPPGLTSDVADASADTPDSQQYASRGASTPTPRPAEPDPKQRREPPSQETTEFDVERHLAAERERDEDVLEETPEFLQDTPEHDRLWFEQRPPRDFDFDG